jgi:hypothetical protein
MSYEKRIHDYLSGELSAQEERELFDLLSEHPEWREELTLQMKMQQAAQKDISSVVVPTSVTSAIFSSLSFTSPEQSSANSKMASGNILGQKVISRFGIFTLTTASAAIIAVGCLVYMLATSSYKEPTRVGPPASRSAPATQIQTTIPPTPEVPAAHSMAKSGQPVFAVAKKDGSNQSIPTRVIANEPMKVYLDIGRFSSVDYLTQHKIIGVADEGKIYRSDDGGRSWVIQLSGTSNDVFGVNFIDTTRGIIVGAKGTILATNDAGHEWHKIKSGVEANLITVRYATPDTVYACGAQGIIMRSTSSGEHWQQLESGTKANLFKIRFDNGLNGFISGEHNLTLETHNGGASWLPKL